jgi:hypothetical protein
MVRRYTATYLVVISSSKLESHPMHQPGEATMTEGNVRLMIPVVYMYDISADDSSDHSGPVVDAWDALREPDSSLLLEIQKAVEEVENVEAVEEESIPLFKVTLSVSVDSALAQGTRIEVDDGTIWVASITASSALADLLMKIFCEVLHLFGCFTLGVITIVSDSDAEELEVFIRIHGGERLLPCISCIHGGQE